MDDGFDNPYEYDFDLRNLVPGYSPYEVFGMFLSDLAPPTFDPSVTPHDWRMIELRDMLDFNRNQAANGLPGFTIFEWSLPPVEFFFPNPGQTPPPFPPMNMT